MAARVVAYKHWLEAGVSEEQLDAIRHYIAQQRALGDDRFQKMVEKTLNRPAIYRSGGRPKGKAI